MITHDKPMTDAAGAPPAEFGLEDDTWLQRARSARMNEPLGQIEGYTILELSATGGQGTVYRCRSADGRDVALKRLHASTSRAGSARARLLRETALVSRLSHPCIVTPRVVEIDGELLLEMDWVEGLPLTAFARERADAPPAGPPMLGLFADICDAIGHAHACGLVHRDLKPSNILVDADGRPHILDFGIARPFSESAADASRLTLTDQIVGTPAYASPEQVRGSAVIDARCDVYSLGVLMYEALTGVSPYPANLSLGRLLCAVEETEPLRPRAINPAIPPAVEAVIIKALQKNPVLRYPDAAALHEDVQRCLRGEQPTARFSPIRAGLRTFRRRHPILALALPILCLAGVAAGVLYDRHERLGRQAVQFVDDVVPRIVETWDPDSILPFAVPDFPDYVPQGERAELFRRLAERFGRVRAYRGSEGVANIPFNPFSDKPPTAIRTAYVECERAMCMIELRLVRQHEQWRIEGFMASAMDQSGTIGSPAESDPLPAADPIRPASATPDTAAVP